MKEINQNQPVVLVICDGLGYAPAGPGNAVNAAPMNFFNNLLQHYPAAYLAAAGEAVGLLPGFIGNSQVGHLTIGAGRVVKSSIAQFHELVLSGQIFDHSAAAGLSDFARTGKTLHILGLLSDGGVHSHELHLYGMLDLAVHCGVKNIVVHPILDGRDVAQLSAATYLERLEKKLHALATGKIGSLQGRFYAMDRDKNWERTVLSYQMMCGLGNIKDSSWRYVLAESYERNETDEFVRPLLFGQENALQDGDAVVFVNVRPDRAMQLTTLLLCQEVQRINKVTQRAFAFVLTGSRYSAALHNPVIFEQESVRDTFLDVVEVAQPERPIFLLAETEKYAHVTYFFKGMRDQHSGKETRIMIPSLKERNYIAHPEMAAASITDELEKILDQHPGALCVVNYANADMVGHSGDLAATASACRVLDQQLVRVYKGVVEKHDGLLVITADHGNAEAMVDHDGNPKTAHTKNSVPFVMVASHLRHETVHEPIDCTYNKGVAFVAPTLLQQMGIERPLAMVEPLFLRNE